MKQTKQFKIALAVLGTILLVIIGILSFYILYNAQWLIGDDYIIMDRTGWDIPFTIWDTTKPEIGRFFPLAYMHENLVLFFPGDMHDAGQHYLINTILFLLLIYALLRMLWIVVKPSNILDLCLVFFSVLLCATRLYNIYLNVFSTLYNFYTLTSIFILCIVLYYEKQKIIYALIALFSSTYMVFCLENVFIIPLTIGTITLLFCWKQLSKQQLGFQIGLIAIAFIYLLIYFIVIYLPSNIDAFYDPSHGTGVSFISNAITILKGQKFLFLAAGVWVYCQIVLIRKKDRYDPLYDSLLWTAGAILLGGLILKLDWQMYYYTAVLFALPSVVYFGNKHFGKTITLVIVILFTCLHGLKIPNYIKNNQLSRRNTIQAVEYLSNEIDQGKELVWYESAVSDSTSFDLILRDWKEICVKSYIQFHRKDSTWDFAADIPNNKYIMLYPLQNDSFAERPTWLPNPPIGMISDMLIYGIPNNTNEQNEYTIQ